MPALTGPVVDGAGLIDAATQNAIVGKLTAFEAKSSHQVVVATVPDLQGYAIEEFGVALGRAWGIGRGKENDGVILLVSSGDRKVRIEVGYGLEGELTDATAKTIIETDIVPRFKSGDYAGGIAKGVDDIVEVLSGDAATLTARAESNAEWRTDDWQSVTSFIVFAFVLVFLIIGMVFRAIRRAAQGPGRGGARRSGPWGSSWSTSFGTGGGSFGGGGSWGGGGSSSGGFSGGGGSFGGGGSSGSW